MKSKDLYWLYTVYINGTTCIATGLKKWGKELKSAGNIDWKAKFNNIGKICYENRLREMKFLAIESLRISLKLNISAAREQQAVSLGPLK